MKVIQKAMKGREAVTESLKRKKGENDAANKWSGEEGFITVDSDTACVRAENICKRPDWAGHAVIQSWSHLKRYTAQLLHHPGAAFSTSNNPQTSLTTGSTQISRWSYLRSITRKPGWRTVEGDGHAWSFCLSTENLSLFLSLDVCSPFSVRSRH